MCEVIKKNREEAAAEALAQGRAEGMLKIAFSMFRKGKLTEAEAAKEAEISISEFRKMITTFTAEMDWGKPVGKEIW